MKTFKILFACFTMLAFLTGCEEEEVTNYAFQDISAPANLVADFDVAQDDTGMVTITPAGEGASTFQIFPGMDGEEPTTVATGESATYTYAEGEYVVRIVAMGPTGLTSEYVQNLMISFRAPENLVVSIEQPASNPQNITVSAAADFASSFDVYFGDADDEEPVQLMPGASLEHTYEEPGSYLVRVVAKGAGAATAETSEIVVVPDANDPIVFPITFDEGTVNYAMETFGGATFEVVANPDQSSVNTSDSNVGALTNSGNTFEGGSFTLGEPVDFSGAAKTVVMKVWSDVSVPVLLKFEGGPNGERDTEVVANHQGTGWEELSFDFGQDAIKSYIDGNQGVGEPFVPTGLYGVMTMFIDGPGTTAGTFYIDDVMLSLGDALQLPMFPITFEKEDTDYTWSGFGASDFGPIPAMVVTNPDQSGINTSANVLEVEKPSGAQVWAGASMDIAGAADFSNSTSIKIKVWSPKPNTPILFKMEDSQSPLDGNGNPTIFVEVQRTTTAENTWEELTFELTDFGDFSASNSYDRVIVFPDFGNAGAGEKFYFDDFFIGDDSGASAGEIGTIGFENGEMLTGVFEDSQGVTGTVVDNPDKSGSNSSDKVYEFLKANGAAWYSGIFNIFDSDINLADKRTFTIKIWSPKADINVRFQLEKEGGGGGETKFVDQTLDTANAWQTLTFDFDGIINPEDAYDKIVIFPNFDDAAQPAGDGSIYYIDDISQE